MCQITLNHASEILQSWRKMRMIKIIVECMLIALVILFLPLFMLILFIPINSVTLLHVKGPASSLSPTGIVLWGNQPSLATNCLRVKGATARNSCVSTTKLGTLYRHYLQKL